MKIRFQSRNGQQNVIVPALLGNELGRWSNGEEKDIPDDRMVSVKLAAGSPVRTVRAIDAVLLAGPDFVDASTGLNPDYVCSECGRETLDSFWVDQALPDGTDKRVRYENAAGEVLCVRDYLAAQPDHSRARRYHAAVEHSTGHRELMEMQAGAKGPGPVDPLIAQLTPGAK